MTATPRSAEGGSLAESGDVSVISRHAGAGAWHCDVRGWNLNPWCVLSGNPFVGPVILMPNSPAGAPAGLEYGPIVFPGEADTLTIFLASSDAREHGHLTRVSLAVLDRGRATLDGSQELLARGENARRTLALGEEGPLGVFLRMSVSFEKFAGGPHFGNVSISYLLAHRGNDLVELFNAAGSDKGTEIGIGLGGVPHCYAVEYEALFSHLRDRPFRMLEIGLQSREGDEGAPIDAPSLRVWHDFFPHAEIYGFDIADFSSFDQSRTTIVQGDQGSLEDLKSLAADHGGEKFELILDDGSHASSDQQISLGALFESVAPGGLYVIEDLHWQPRPESPTTLEVLRTFIDSAEIRSPFIDEEATRYLESAIDRVEIHKPNDSEFAAIYKKAD